MICCCLRLQTRVERTKMRQESPQKHVKIQQLPSKRKGHRKISHMNNDAFTSMVSPSPCPVFRYLGLHPVVQPLLKDVSGWWNGTQPAVIEAVSVGVFPTRRAPSLCVTPVEGAFTHTVPVDITAPSSPAFGGFSFKQWTRNQVTSIGKERQIAQEQRLSMENSVLSFVKLVLRHKIGPSPPRFRWP